MAGSTDSPLAGLTVLIVEDEFLIAMEAQAIVEDAGGTVLLANSVARVREYLDSEDEIDAALVDLKLGDGDTLPLLADFRLRRIPVVVASGFDAGRDLPGIPVVAKPYRSADVLAAIQSVLAEDA